MTVHSLPSALALSCNRPNFFPGLLTNGIVLEHAERAVGARAAEGHEEARQGHRHEAHRDGS